MKIMLDAGHGYSTPGKRSPDGMREYEFNRRVAEVMKTELEKYENVTVYMSHSDNRDVPLKERTDMANRLNVDVFFSIHANALAGKMGNHGGIETFVYTTKPKEATALATVVQNNLIKKTGLRNRGVKAANFHVLRETKMTAILVEHGFMDSYTDLPKLKSDSFRVLCAMTNVESLVQFYKLKKKSSQNNTNTNVGRGTSIFGQTKSNVDQMSQFVMRHNKNFNPLIAKAFLDIGKKYNIRGDIAFCQSILETDWFRFGNGTAVTPDQHNYCGLGVVQKGVKGHSFPTIELGVTAQIQHLYAYASKNNLPAGEILIDPRFKYVNRGSAPTWEELGGKWAADKNYGSKILNIYNQMLNFKPTNNVVNNKVENKQIMHIKTEYNGKDFNSVVIDGKGYVRVTEIAEALGYRAVLDKSKNKIVFLKG